MPTPFPGMDPYLEQRGLWERIHTRLIVAMADALNPLVGERYWVDVEQRTYLAVLAPDELVGKPDVLVLETPGISSSLGPTINAVAEVQPLLAELPMPEEIVEHFLEVRDVTNDEVITVIELLSPVNKTSRDGRTAYLNKRLKVLGSQTNLVEIDLLRVGESLPLRIAGQHPPYSIVVSRAWQRPQASVYFFGIRDPIPRIPIPLRRNENEPILDINRLLHEIYERVGYQRVINYREATDPPLKGQDAAWANALLSEHGLRS